MDNEIKAHSPGPWRRERDDDGVNIIRPASDVALSGDAHYYPWVSNNDAGWALISAAPEMLEMLKRLTEGMYPEDNGYSRALAVIRKAEGR